MASSNPPSSDPSVSKDTDPTTTVMIYLAGDNNLSQECIYALTELKKAQASYRVEIIVQYDPSDEFLPTQRYLINRCGQDHFDGPIAEDLIDQFPFHHESHNCLPIRAPFGERRERRGEGGTGDPKMLFNFVAFCVDRPDKPHHEKTDHYILIICGHGAGVQRDFLLRDDSPDGNLTIHELQLALRNIKEKLRNKWHRPLVLDIFGMDVCLMSMAEITYELRGLVKTAIGCESYGPAAGWPYQQTIKEIDIRAQKRVAIDQRAWQEISEKIVKQYVRFYSDYWLGGLSVTMSALNVSKVKKLRRLVRALAQEMIDELNWEFEKKGYQQDTGIIKFPKDCDWYKSPPPERSAQWSYEDPCKQQTDECDDYKECDEDDDKEDEEIHHRFRQGSHHYMAFSDALVLAHWRAQSYNGELYVDLADFCDCLAPYAPEYIAGLCRKLSRFIKCEFTILSCSWGRQFQYSYGISIYFPWDSLVPYYGASIDFPADAKWINFLKKYLQVTRREPRNFDPHKHNHLLSINRDGDVRMGSDKMGSDKMGSDKGGNPIHSMRNPPIVFIPSCCFVAEHEKENEKKSQHDQDILRLRTNADAQEFLMHRVELSELLPDSELRAKEASTPARTLLLKTEDVVSPTEIARDDVGKGPE